MLSLKDTPLRTAGSAVLPGWKTPSIGFVFFWTKQQLLDYELDEHHSFFSHINHNYVARDIPDYTEEAKILPDNAAFLTCLLWYQGQQSKTENMAYVTWHQVMAWIEGMNRLNGDYTEQ